ARSHPDEEERQRAHQLVELLTPLCKSHCSDVGHDVCIMAMQTLGGAGYTRDHVVEQMARDVKVASIYEGANGIQALDLIGRKLSAHHGQSFQLLMEALEATFDGARDHPVLGELASLLAEAQDTVRRVTGNLASRGLSGDVKGAALYASPYLTLLSHLVTGWLLVEQAAVAQGKLEALWKEKGLESEEERATLLEGRDDARFLDNKVRTARFYVKTLLRENEGLAAQVEDGDFSILHAVL
ncbi:MAG: acyl-CoA dehydrogenase, partial [Gemmatimonadetes bacterium]